MSKIAVVGLARTASRRLPNKVVFDLGGKPAFVHCIERTTNAVKADYTFVACTEFAQDDPIALLAKHYKIECYRGATLIGPRCMLLAEQQMDLKDDDWWIPILCDNPLGIAKFLPWALEQAEKHNCDLIGIVMPKGSLADAFQPITSYFILRWGIRKKTWLLAHRVDEGHTYRLNFSSLGAQKCLIMHWPPEYLVSWPWGLMFLDYPIQAIVLKEIYRRLYKEVPIDVFDVQKLFQEDPRLRSMIPLKLPYALDNILSEGDYVPELENIKLSMEYIELTWNPKQENSPP